MKKNKKHKYWIAAIIWLITMILANYLNEYLQTPPWMRGVTVGFWTVAAYLLFKDLVQPRIGKKKEDNEDKE